MTLDELYERALMFSKMPGDSMTLILPTKRPKGFPRGELLCVGHEGDKVYTVSPRKILKWLKANGYPSSGDKSE
jgi:hypothetical protein